MFVSLDFINVTLVIWSIMSDFQNGKNWCPWRLFFAFNVSIISQSLWSSVGIHLGKKVTGKPKALSLLMDAVGVHSLLGRKNLHIYIWASRCCLQWCICCYICCVTYLCYLISMLLQQVSIGLWTKKLLIVNEKNEKVVLIVTENEL